ncbi:MAG: hypothetical protein KJP00_16570 [Bacteroidia bacterium]|nr:hypothetical protein [Bacteroidia bacterium]
MQLNIQDDYFHLTDPEIIATQFSGDSNSDFLIVIPQDCANMELIQKILSAINISDISDIQVLELRESDSISIFPFLKRRNIQKMISFGIPSKRLGIHVEHQLYQPLKFQEKDLIFTADIIALKDQSNHKKLLWSALKTWI